MLEELAQNINRLHVLSSLGMFGVIWIIQLVHYPAFLFCNKENFREFELYHVKRMTLFVAPMMVLELFCSLALAYLNPGLTSFILLFLVVLIWGVTFLVSVPLHNELAKAHDINKIHKLIKTNWLRTLGWSLRAGIITANLPWS